MCRSKTSALGPTLLVFLLLIGTTTVAMASEYMPLEPGRSWSYTNEVEASIGSVDYINGQFATPLTFSWPTLNGRTFWLTDDATGPMLVDITVYESGYLGPGGYCVYSWSYGFESPIRLFELPLTPGAELGPVRYNNALLMDTSVPVAVEHRSWSDIKCLYR